MGGLEAVMIQWLYLLVILVALVAAWTFVVRPWLERRATPIDERRHADRGASREARERMLRDRNRIDEL